MNIDTSEMLITIVAIKLEWAATNDPGTIDAAFVLTRADFV